MLRGARWRRNSVAHHSGPHQPDDTVWGYPDHQDQVHNLKTKPLFVLLILTFAALFIHGYHPWAEDAEIYLPGVEKILNPALFPFNAQFFQSHAHLTLFPNLIATSIRITHLPLVWAIFLWHLLSIFLFLYAAWELMRRCFASNAARWCGVALLTALFTMPVAGTALYIIDQYLNPRNLTAFAGLLAIAKVLDKKYVQAGLLLVFAAAIHPLMAVFVVFYSALLLALEKWVPETSAPRQAVGGLLPLGLALPFGIGNTSQAYHQVAVSHNYHYLVRWEWYELLGALAPFAILWWFSRMARQRGWRNIDPMCRALIVFEAVNLAGALVLSLPAFESLARLQPMRSLYLVYVLMILFGGGFLGEFVLKNHVWRWALLFVPLCAGMFMAQRQLFPASAHVEWPWAAPKNAWVQAFVWVRGNTPEGAIFALDPHHMELSGEDQNGFRAIAQRSMLADETKDSGAVTMFPPNAEVWLQQTQAEKGWKTFQAADFERLHRDFGVTWVVLQQPGVAALECPYENAAVRVCRIAMR
jgi:hypothetical protein